MCVLIKTTVETEGALELDVGLEAVNVCGAKGFETRKVFDGMQFTAIATVLEDGFGL